jgi:hypothetical protein
MTGLFHKDIGLPANVQQPSPWLPLRYSRHALHQAEVKHIDPLPARVPVVFTLIEVELKNGEPQKWVIRFPLTKARDLVMVVMADGFVKTVWTNAHDDLHHTLNRSIYTKVA